MAPVNTSITPRGSIHNASAALANGNAVKVLDANSGRKYLMIQNKTGNDALSVFPGPAADYDADKSATLAAGEKLVLSGEFVYAGIITLKGTSGNKFVCWEG